LQRAAPMRCDAGKAGCSDWVRQVEGAIARESIVGLVHAADAGSDGVAKLAGALRHRPDADQVTMI